MEVSSVLKTAQLFIVSSLIFSVNCQFDLAPELPSHLPAPPKAEPPPANSGGGSSPLSPPQNVPSGLIGSGIPPGELVPFGLNHVILIIVPQFKTKYQKLPDWVASSVKVAMPITVFFDQLDVPPGMLIPGPGGLPPLPLGVPPVPGQMPFPVRPVPPPGSAANAQMSPSYAYYSHRPYGYGDDGNPNDDDPEEGYENDSYYPEEERSLDDRRKRETCLNKMTCDNLISHYEHQVNIRRKRAVSYNATIHKSERVSIIPKLEKILNSAGLEGKSCLLRAICEVHEVPLTHYGLMGEILTLFFSISRSAFAETHLSEYRRAEEIGKMGDCTEFHRDCENTLFYHDE